LHEARRVPRRVRVAYVSRIPRNKRAEMQAKLADEAAAQASGEADSADEPPPPTPSRTHGRPRMRIRLRS
jgi:hypothetical protein